MSDNKRELKGAEGEERTGDRAYVSAFGGKTNCKLCGQDGELRLGVCFDCASAQEIIGEQVLKENKPTETNKIIRTLAEKGYLIVEKSFVDEAEGKGIKRDILR
jgi:hypothetical protein